MQVKIFTGNNMTMLENNVNQFLKNLPNSDIVKVETTSLSTQVGDMKVSEVAVFVWLTSDAKEA